MSLPSHGDVTAEYLALRGGCGLVAGATELGWARGPDAVTFLDGLLSQDIAAIPSGGVARSLLLEPRGKLRALLWLLRGEEAVGLIADAGAYEDVASDLGRYRIRVDVELDAAAKPALELWGPGSASVLAAAGCPVPDAGGWVGEDGVVAAHAPLGGLARYVVTGADGDVLVAAGARPAGTLAVDTVRIEAGEPRMGVDVDHKTIPQESGLVPQTVSFTKGCYLGQELVARIDTRGRVNRHLRGVAIAENVLPPLGSQVVAGETTVGTITSLGESLELRAPVALGLLRREVEPGAEVEIRWDKGAAMATVHELPLDDFAGG